MSDERPTREELERRLAAAERRLEERESYFRRLLYTLHEDILVIDRDWTIVDCNNTRLTTTGHTRDEVIGQRCFEVLHGSEVPCEQVGEECALRQVFADGEPANCHHMHRRKDGSIWHADLLFSPLKDADGKVTHVIEAVRDVTDLFAAQEAERRAAQETKATLASITDGFFALDEDMVVTYYNPAAARALGRPAEEVLGRKLFDAFPEARGSIFEARYTEALRERRALSFETYFGVPPLEGWYEVRVYPRERGISVFFQVITERRQAREALERSERKFRTLFEMSPDAIAIADDEGRYVDVNDACCELFGVEREALLGRAVADFAAPGYDTTSTWAAFQRDGEATGVFRLQRPDGSVREIEFAAVSGFQPGHHLSLLRDVTDEVRQEHELRRRAVEYRTLADSLPDIVTRFDPELRHTFVSKAIEPVTGLRPEEFIGRTDRDLGMPAELVEDWEGALRRVLETGEPQVIEYRFAGRNGDRQFEGRLVPELDEDGSVRSVLGINRDVTEWVEAEQALRESEARYRQLFDAAPVGVGHWDAEGRLVAFNDYAANQIGGEGAPYVGRTIEEVHGAAMGAVARRRFADVAMSGESGDYEDEVELPGGRKWFVSRYSALRDETGVVTGYQIASLDITERKRAEQQLRASEARYRLVAENSLDVIWQMDLERTFLYASPSITQVFGFTPEEFVGTKLEDHTDADDLGDLERALERELENVSEGVIFETRFRHRDGHLVPVEVHAKLVLDADGTPRMVQGTTRDVSERAAAEHELRASEARLREAERLAGLGNWEYDVPGQSLAWWSEGTYRIFGLDPSAGLPNTDDFFDRIDPESREAVRAAIEETVTRGGPRSVTYKAYRSDGQPIWVEATLHVQGDDEGPATTLVGTVQDVTSSVENARKLRAREHLLTEIGRLARVGGWEVVLPDGKLTWTTVTREIHEVDEGYEPTLETAFEFFHPDDRSALRAAFSAAVERGEPYDLELRFTTARGRELWTRTHCSPIVENGRIVKLVGTFQDVSEAVRARGELRDRSRFLARLIEALPFPIFFKGTDGRYLGCNERFLKLVGKSREEVVGQPLDEVARPELVATYRQRDAELFETGGVQVYEIEMPDASGEARPMLFNKATFEDDRGEVAGIIGSIIDLSDLRRAEAGERKRLRQLAAVNRVARQAASRLDRGELFEAVTAEIRDAFGYHNVTILVLDAERRELVFQSIAGAHEGKIKPGYRQSIELGLTGTAATTGAASVCSDIREETRYVVGFDGEVDTLAEVAVPIVVGGEVAAVLDVQEDRTGAFDDTDVQMLETVAGQIGAALANTRLFERIQEELAGRREVEAVQQRLATAVDQAAEAIVITDANGTIEYVNPAFERVTGYGRDEAIGENPSILKSGRHDEEFYRQLWKTIGSGSVWVGSMHNRRKDGSEFIEESVISPIRDANGAITHFVAVKRDVTREREVEEQLRQMQKLEAIGRLAGGVAHDFNNLLQAMLASTQMLGVTADNPSEVKSTAAEVEELVRKGSALTRQLLLFARRGVSRREQIDLGELVSGSEKLLRRLLRENIHISVESPPEAIAVEVDRGQIEQVIMNLAVNAADAMPEGGTLRLVAGFGDEGEACLEVTDSGVGIPAEMLEKIFEPFFTTKSADRGTGLGLAVVHGIVSQHGGRVSIESRVGVGTTFRITLPLEGAVDQSHGAGSTTTAASAERGAGEKILVIEDNDGVRRLLTRLLERLGYEVTAVGSAEEALELPKQPGFAALLSDVMLPGAPGPEVANVLKARWPDLAVILMSGYAEEEVLKEGLSHKEFRFLQKPVELVALSHELRAALDN